MVESHVGDDTQGASKNRSKAESADGSAAKHEQRSFDQTERAAEDARSAAKSSLQAGKELASSGQDAMRKASGQAVELWRASLDPLSNL